MYPCLVKSLKEHRSHFDKSKDALFSCLYPTLLLTTLDISQLLSWYSVITFIVVEEDITLRRWTLLIYETNQQTDIQTHICNARIALLRKVQNEGLKDISY